MKNSKARCREEVQSTEFSVSSSSLFIFISYSQGSEEKEQQEALVPRQAGPIINSHWVDGPAPAEAAGDDDPEREEQKGEADKKVGPAVARWAHVARAQSIELLDVDKERLGSWDALLSRVVGGIRQ